MKNFFALTIAGVMMFSVTGCFDKQEDTGAAEKTAAAEEKTEAETEAEPDGEQDVMTYMSPDGYQLRYDPKNVESVEIDEHTENFVYIGESAGTSMLTVSYIDGKQPEEVLYELTESWGEQEDLARTEGLFPGTDDKWGFWRIQSDSEGGSGLYQTAIAGEYNGGVLMFEIIEHMGDDEEMNTAVSDTLSGIIDSITYDNFEPQVMYEYVSGEYSQTDEDNKGYHISLNEDHTGTAKLDEDIPVFWGSYELIAADRANTTFEYSIEGDDLYLNYNGDWLSFAKE